MTVERKKIGIVASGSLSEGLEVKLDSPVSIEEVAVGRYVTIEGEKKRFFGLITDVKLKSLDQSLIHTSPDLSKSRFHREVISGTAVYGVVNVLPLLTIDALSLLEGPQPAKTIPCHFSPVFQSSQRDVELVFGKEDERRFYVGNPLDMETKICLDLEEFVKRSNGIFGKSGTGKTFIARLLLIGVLQRGLAANLVFDMHSEYGWEGRDEQGRKVKGLKQLFPSKVAVFSLDEESSLRRKVSTDYIVKIGYDEIEPEDIQLLQETLNLTEAAIHSCYKLTRRFGEKNWLREFLNLETREEVSVLASSLGEHEATMMHLRRRLEILKRLPFLIPEAKENWLKRVLDYLDRGISVVLEFGRWTDIVAYILVANLLTRRIYAQYRERMERALGGDGSPPYPLLITIEEAHRFLNPKLSNQTIFGTIAREMRKYNVTLLVIDQRPSGIDEEVMSQLGTKICCLMDNERDIDSVLTGVANKELKQVLSRLESKQQALFFGHSIPMPVVVKIREYGSAQSYKELGFKEPAELKKKAEKDIEDLWG